ncbi:DUF1684 domain-containing protein [Cellulomonas palmilytica]|uniref:DUF1684 domain-containing protein n=1 Tax=Cellulomonas palmilytica TaxID=2608402 RepID=UPI001F27B146|nr:DUF1684 domain-containing protein [Cellulomonas palmilytica]UJP40047.1 DUF1684 domain-containing protein [Cellulomonas palmilytica]
MTTLDTRTQEQADWATWHEARERDLATPHGWLTLVAYLDLPSTPTALADVPGLWWADEDGAHHARTADLSGATTHVVAEAGSQVVQTYTPQGRTGADADVAVELVRRTGRYAIRLRDPRAAALRDFDGVPTFPYDASWVLDVPVRWYDEPRAAVVGAARPGLVHHVSVVGEVDLERDGRTVTLRLTGGKGGAPALLFTDEAPGLAPWRIVFPEPSADRSTVRLDLNRALNLPYAFSDFGTCPAPLEGNHVPFAVAAGERAPR